MNAESSQFAGEYLVALQAHVEQGSPESLALASPLGHQALKLGLATQDLARIHAQTLVALTPPGHLLGDGDESITRAESFFTAAMIPLEALPSTVGKAKPRSKSLHQLTLSLITMEQRLQRETLRRQVAETALKKSQQHHTQLLAESQRMQEQLRHLSHQMLRVQEEERRKISRELHDDISQILTGINVRLAALKIEATANAVGLKQKIAKTQRLVQKSVAAVHRFARQLRPAMLDDLGLIPTLHAYIKDWGRRTGLKMEFAAATVAEIEQADSLKQTVLYRVVLEALTNVDKHAHASVVKLSIRTQSDAICMEINDNGTAFEVNSMRSAKPSHHLGILGMRERVEMVGGTFAIESAPGQGTTIRVQIPFHGAMK